MGGLGSDGKNSFPPFGSIVAAPVGSPVAPVMKKMENSVRKFVTLIISLGKKNVERDMNSIFPIFFCANDKLKKKYPIIYAIHIYVLCSATLVLNLT